MFDAVYTPRITRLLREAEECGAITVSGSEMFVRQAYEQFEIFTGLPGKCDSLPNTTHVCGSIETKQKKLKFMLLHCCAAPKELYWQIMSKY